MAFVGASDNASEQLVEKVQDICTKVALTVGS